MIHVAQLLVAKVVHTSYYMCTGFKFLWCFSFFCLQNDFKPVRCSVDCVK